MDWISLVNEIQAAGWTEQMIAGDLNVNRSTINRLKHGHINEPLYSTGKGLIQLRGRVCRKRN